MYMWIVRGHRKIEKEIRYLFRGTKKTTRMKHKNKCKMTIVSIE